MELRHWLVVLPLAAVACSGGAAPPPPPVAADTRTIVEHLADDELEGRLTGSPGIRRAADYIIEQLKAIGAEPLPGRDGYRQAFDYTAGVTDAGTTVAITRSDGTPLSHPDGDGPFARAMSFSDNGAAEGQLVFAGYGLSVPETDGFSYDSYATLDVSGKIAIVLRYFPEDTEGDLRATLARYSGLRYKALAAARAGRRRTDRGHRTAVAQRRRAGGAHLRHRGERLRHRGRHGRRPDGEGHRRERRTDRSGRCRRRSIPPIPTLPASSCRLRPASM